MWFQFQAEDNILLLPQQALKMTLATKVAEFTQK
jgi:hypothetical protein